MNCAIETIKSQLLINVPSLFTEGSRGAHGDAYIQNLMLEVRGRRGRERGGGTSQRAADAATTAALSHEWKMLSVTTVDWK